MKHSDATLTRFAQLWQQMEQRGFAPVTEESVGAWAAQHAYCAVLLNSDPIKTPEVADNVVIIPELLREFPHYDWQIATADLAHSEAIADRLRISKFPAVIFFRHGELIGVISGLHPWGELVIQCQHLLSGDHVSVISMTDPETGAHS